MKRLIGTAVCCIICLTSLAAAAGDIEIRGPLFLPIAFITERGKIMDENHVLLGRIDKEGIVYDVDNKHLGFIEEDLTVRDVHYKTVATIDGNGAVTDGNGVVVGAVTDTKISDAEGRPIIRYEGPQDKRAILAYLFFFLGGFPN
jgi:hypothetical protein